MASISVDQDHFMCSVCLDLLKDPVTLHCGHTYCMRCITDCWDQDDQTGIYSCPQCRQTFSPRPVLGKNVVVAEMVEKLKKTRLSGVCYAGAGDVECDVCTGRKHKAIKSCLTCLKSYCQTHLERHEEFLSGNSHKIVTVTRKLKEMICPQHQKLLEVFCRTDQQCVCLMCLMDEHKNHDTVSAAAQRTHEEKHLKETQRKFQEKIHQREKDVQELRDAVECHKRCAQTTVEDCEMMLTEVMSLIERRRSEVTQLIRDQETAAVSPAEGLLERLKQEIDDLRRRDAELDKISHTDDHITFLQSFQSLSAPPESPDDISVTFLISFDAVRESVRQLRDKLQDFCTQPMRKISVTHTNTVPRIRDDFLQYSHQLTLDLNTLNKNLCLSEGNRTITNTFLQKCQYPNHPDRFDDACQVLCKESVCGRCYWEIERTGVNNVFISVSYKSIRRKGPGDECWFGYNDQSWSLICSDSSYSFRHNKIKTKLPVKLRSDRLGVYVDERAGILSFYSISDTMTLIHSISTTFTQPLYPGFTVCHNSSVKLCDL
ncbi:tripartite motif-containing protein 16-like isoform X1 [Triplophysa rosa]|uniref:tripartite motif-containing protein 16-like isoform X1 n=1 Tax=Triplophysa rosa TaxID=992332 RepID=UPI002545C78D|nr:tripartite motif-containing protein 16-like isoform X1 [Triplophysa rosa]